MWPRRRGLAANVLKTLGWSIANRTEVIVVPVADRQPAYGVKRQRRMDRIFRRPRSSAAARQRNLKDRPVRSVGRCPKAPTVGLNDRPTNAKSYSCSRRLCREEWLEDTFLVFPIYSR